MNFGQWLLTESKDFSSTQLNFPKTSFLSTWSTKHIADSDLYTEPDGHKGREKEFHITVLYGLHTENAKQVEKLVSGFGPVVVKLGKINKFTNRDEFDVLKIDIISEDIRRLHKLLANLDFTSDYDSYKPHCTLAYVKKGACAKLVGSDVFSGKTQEFKELIFSNKKREKTTISLI